MPFVLNLVGRFLQALGRGFHLFFGVEPCCRFRPSCSQYVRESVTRHGVVRGGFLAVGRLVRCRPGGGFGWDPVR